MFHNSESRYVFSRKCYYANLYLHDVAFKNDYALMWISFPHQIGKWKQIIGSNAANEQQNLLIDWKLETSVERVTSVDTTTGKIEALFDDDLAQNVD